MTLNSISEELLRERLVKCGVVGADKGAHGEEGLRENGIEEMKRASESGRGFPGLLRLVPVVFFWFSGIIWQPRFCERFFSNAKNALERVFFLLSIVYFLIEGSLRCQTRRKRLPHWKKRRLKS